MKKFILSLMCFFFVVFSGISYAVTINTAQINGKYYGLTGALNNPAVGVAVELGSAMLTKANPWITGMGLALTVYKIAEELFPGQVVAFRPGLVSEAVPTWTNNQPPSTDPGLVGPDGYDYLSGYMPNGTPWDHTVQEAAQRWINYAQPSNPNTTFAYVSTCAGTPAPCWVRSSYDVNSHTTTYYDYPLAARATVKTCPSGYTLTSGVCNLNNAASVKYPSDGVSTYISDGAGHFIPDPRDPDLPASNLSGLSGQSSVTQKSSDGTQSSTTQMNPDGSISHTTTNNYYDSADSSYHQYTQNVTINNAGAVTSFSASNPVVQAVNGAFTPVSPTPLTITLPTDYARQGEAQTAANSTNAKLDIVHNDLNTPPSTDPSLDTEKTLLDTNTDAHKSYFNGLGAKAQSNEGGALSYALPQPVMQDNTCTDPVVTVFTGSSLQKSITITGYCAAILKVRSILGWLMYILTLYLLFDIVTGRKEEG